MKKITFTFCIVTVIFCALFLTACGGFGGKESSDNANTNSSQTNETDNPNNPNNPNNPSVSDIEITVNLEMPSEEYGKNRVETYALSRSTTIGEYRLREGENSYEAVTFYNRYEILYNGNVVGDDFCIDKNMTITVKLKEPEYVITVENDYGSSEQYAWGEFTYYQWFLRTRYYLDQEAIDFEWWREHSEYEITLNGKPVEKDSVINGNCTIAKKRRDIVSTFEFIIEENQIIDSTYVYLELYQEISLTEFVEKYFLYYCDNWVSDVLTAELQTYQNWFDLYLNDKLMNVESEELQNFVIDKDLTVTLKLKDTVTLEFYVDNKFDSQLYGPYSFDWAITKEGFPLYEITEAFREDVNNKYPTTDGQSYFDHNFRNGYYYLIENGQYVYAENYSFTNNATIIFNEWMDLSACNHANSKSVEPLCSNTRSHFYCEDCSNYYFINDLGNPYICYSCNLGGIKDYSLTFYLNNTKTETINFEMEGEIFFDILLKYIPGCEQGLEYNPDSEFADEIAKHNSWLFGNYSVVVNGTTCSSAMELLDAPLSQNNVVKFNKLEDATEDYFYLLTVVVNDERYTYIIGKYYSLSYFIEQTYFCMTLGKPTEEYYQFTKDNKFFVNGSLINISGYNIQGDVAVTIVEKTQEEKDAEAEKEGINVPYTFISPDGLTITGEHAHHTSTYTFTIADAIEKCLPWEYTQHFSLTDEGWEIFLKYFEVLLNGELVTDRNCPILEENSVIQVTEKDVPNFTLTFNYVDDDGNHQSLTYDSKYPCSISDISSEILRPLNLWGNWLDGYSVADESADYATSTTFIYFDNAPTKEINFYQGYVDSTGEIFVVEELVQTVSAPALYLKDFMNKCLKYKKYDTYLAQGGYWTTDINSDFKTTDAKFLVDGISVTNIYYIEIIGETCTHFTCINVGTTTSCEQNGNYHIWCYYCKAYYYQYTNPEDRYDRYYVYCGTTCEDFSPETCPHSSIKYVRDPLYCEHSDCKHYLCSLCGGYVYRYTDEESGNTIHEYCGTDCTTEP